MNEHRIESITVYHKTVSNLAYCNRRAAEGGTQAEYFARWAEAFESMKEAAEYVARSNAADLIAGK